MKTTHYNIPAKVSATIAVLADFHSRNDKKQNSPKHIDSILEKLASNSPNFIVCPGDILNHTDELSVDEYSNSNGYRLLKEARKIAPVYYSIGNHEHGINIENRRMLEANGIVVLDNEISKLGDICIGGFTTGFLLDKNNYNSQPVPNLNFISDFSKEQSYKLLLCHHPEYWKKYIVNSGVDLTISGHAHGGQWGFFSRGVYAPGQGLFPKYVKGVHRHDNEYLAVSRGMTNTVPVPRLFDPCEVVILHLGR